MTINLKIDDSGDRVSLIEILTRNGYQARIHREFSRLDNATFVAVDVDTRDVQVSRNEI